MIRTTKLTSRPLDDNEFTTLNFLKTLHPDWYYVGVVGDMKVFKLVILE